tara:strand:+ start:153 stop:596 length:444 start_codon:yes stop_codon:yes gene_type:complete
MKNTEELILEKLTQDMINAPVQCSAAAAAVRVASTEASVRKWSCAERKYLETLVKMYGNDKDSWVIIERMWRQTYSVRSKEQLKSKWRRTASRYTEASGQPGGGQDATSPSDASMHDYTFIDNTLSDAVVDHWLHELNSSKNGCLPT